MSDEYLTDEEQVEALKRWFAVNGPWLIGGAVLGVALLVGYRYYEGHRNTQAMRAATEFGVVTSALQGNDGAKAREVANGIIKQYPDSPYADQARLTIARIAIEDGKLADAVAPLEAVKNDSRDSELRRVAALRLARLQIDLGKPDAALATLPAAPAGAFAALEHEVRGDALYAKKDLAGARGEYEAAMAAADKSGVDTALLELKLADLGAAPASKPKDKT